jgi:fumarate reductase subunit D
LIVWSIVGFALPYIPVGQQRKLVMGLHIPLCILCAYALCRLIAMVPQSYRQSVFFIIILVMMLSNIKFVSQDMRLLATGRTVTHYAPFMSDSDLSAMRWLRSHTKVDDTVFAPPTFALFTPAFTGHQVYYGHWSETPDYAFKLNDWFNFAGPGATDEMRAAVFETTGAKYVAGYPMASGSMRRYFSQLAPGILEKIPQKVQ